MSRRRALMIDDNILRIKDRIYYPNIFNPSDTVYFDKDYYYFRYARSNYNRGTGDGSYTITNPINNSVTFNLTTFTWHGVGYNIPCEVGKTYYASIQSQDNLYVGFTVYDENGKSLRNTIGSKSASISIQNGEKYLIVSVNSQYLGTFSFSNLKVIRR